MAGGSYKTNKKGERQLQFPVNDDVVSKVKAGVFGKYSLPQAKEYIKGGFKSLTGEQTKLYEDTNINYDKLNSYFDYSSSQSLKDDKGNIQYTDGNNNVYWYDSKNKTLYDSNYKQSTKDIKDLNKSSKKENLINYINDNMQDISSDDKWKLYQYNIISTTENDDGKSQLTRAEDLIKNKLTTRDEYMNLYNKFTTDGIDIPDQKTTDKLIENKINLNTYYNFKKDLKEQKLKNEQEFKSLLPVSKEKKEESTEVTDKQKCAILQDSKYTDKEKQKLYENFVGSDDNSYNNLKLLTDDNISINAYLDYKQQDIKGTDDPKSIIKGKTISGSKKKNVEEYLRTSNLSQLEQAYIYGHSYSLNKNYNNYYTTLTNQIENMRSKLTEEQIKDIYKSLHNVQELEDGRLIWK